MYVSLFLWSLTATQLCTTTVSSFTFSPNSLFTHRLIYDSVRLLGSKQLKRLTIVHGTEKACSRHTLQASENSSTDNVGSKSSTEASNSVSVSAPNVATALNGKRVLPFKIISTGLKNDSNKIAAVYAVSNKGGNAWEYVQHVGITQDLGATLRNFERNIQQHSENTSKYHIRALHFSFPQPNAMQSVKEDWIQEAENVGANVNGDNKLWNDIDPMEYLYDEDDDDDDEDDWDPEMTATAMASASSLPSSQSQIVQPSTKAASDVSAPDDSIVSPFQNDNNIITDAAKDVTDKAVSGSDDNADSSTEFSIANVDKVLDEVRPYLIADGGNVSVDSVKPDTMQVYLKLEGACGSCASSTVTMQMGIERVLKEKWPNLREVIKVEDEESGKPTSLSWDAVENEINRIKPAITAMGGVVRLIEVSEEFGSVKVQYRGANKVQKGLELALLDVPFVNHVEFVMGSE